MKRLFLDDLREPVDAYTYTHNKVYLEEWDVVKHYTEFTEYIEKNGIPDIVSFDHDLSDFDQESWKDVDDYKGIYKVSSLGRVLRIKKSKGTSGNNMLIPSKKESGLEVRLRNRGNDKKYLIHRLIAKAFIPNLKNKPQINHKDGNRWNNHLHNLEWSTNSENTKHSHDYLDREYTAYGENHSNSKTVSQYDKYGNLINIYGSVNEAGRQLNIQFTNIAKCCRNERKTAGGFIWKYENKNITVKSKVSHIKKEDKNYIDRFFIPETFKEKTGYHCAKWLVQYCIDNKLELPKEIFIHSMNVIGGVNIASIFETYNKYRKGL